MYPVGTKIQIIDGGRGSSGADELVGVVTDELPNCGLFEHSPGFNVRLVGRTCYGNTHTSEIWRVHNDGKYVVIDELKAEERSDFDLLQLVAEMKK